MKLVILPDGKLLIFDGAGKPLNVALSRSMLNAIVSGQSNNKPAVLIAHGLYGSARNWGVIAKRLSDTRQVVAVDMRNHGKSDWFESHSYPELARDLANVIDNFGGKMDVIGHSMGGKAAMVLGVDFPKKINRLVVADIAPTAYTHTQIHLIEAMNSIEMDAIQTRSDADQMLAPLVEIAGVRAFLLQSLDVKEKQWRLNLNVLADEMDKIIGFPELEATFDGPALFLSGAESDYVKRENRSRIKALFPAAVFAKIPGAGHWLHAEKPREFEAAVRTFLDR